jgi:hypothetical protein
MLLKIGKMAHRCPKGLPGDEYTGESRLPGDEYTMESRVTCDEYTCDEYTSLLITGVS